LQRASTKLVAWSADGKQAAVMKRLRAQADGLCSKAGMDADDRAACQALLKPAPKKTA
jgi:hypothetical protein